ncbi:hypothetical protein C8F01DRAFT_559554 [Mycena amicta]|nr:hypothetical protein C8F01DRAFT_559554 [Mycena amicta]
MPAKHLAFLPSDSPIGEPAHLAFLPSDSPLREPAVPHETSSEKPHRQSWFWSLRAPFRELYGATPLESGENAGRLGSALEALDLAGVKSPKKPAAAYSRQLTALNLEIPVYSKPEPDDSVLPWTPISDDSSQASNSSLGSWPDLEPLALADDNAVLSSPGLVEPLPLRLSSPVPSSSDDAWQASDSEQGYRSLHYLEPAPSSLDDASQASNGSLPHLGRELLAGAVRDLELA